MPVLLQELVPQGSHVRHKARVELWVESPDDTLGLVEVLLVPLLHGRHLAVLLHERLTQAVYLLRCTGHSEGRYKCYKQTRYEGVARALRSEAVDRTLREHYKSVKMT